MLINASDPLSYIPPSWAIIIDKLEATWLILHAEALVALELARELNDYHTIKQKNNMTYHDIGIER